MAKILVVEDREWQSFRYLKDIRRLGHEARGVSDTDGLWEILREYQPDLVILNLNLQGANGWDIFLRIKLYDLDVPVILTARDPCCKDDPRAFLADACVFDRSLSMEAVIEQCRCLLAQRRYPRRTETITA